jgi:hypothetical protein
MSAIDIQATAVLAAYSVQAAILVVTILVQRWPVVEPDGLEGGLFISQPKRHLA